jgi:carbamoyl-phosphate synthase large subunit
MKTVLISGIGGPTPRSIATTIRKNNSDFRIIGIDANPKALGFYMPGLVDKFYVAPRINESDYWPFIINLISEEKIDMAFVQPEVEVIGWGDYYNSNHSFPCPVLIPPVQLASVLIDKAKMADALKETEFIPKTMKVTQAKPQYQEVESEIGFPCWIRATRGSGGLGALKLTNTNNYKSWLFINTDIKEFTVSTFLPGRHLATQMLYYKGEYIKGASLECVEYIMASIAPSKVTGNTSYGRFINEDRILKFCDACVRFICDKFKVPAHGVLSFDLKEDADGSLKVTEINIRHMAYTGVMARVGFDLIGDTITILESGGVKNIKKSPFFHYDQPYAFLRDVDVEPIVVNDEILGNTNV